MISIFVTDFFFFFGRNLKEHARCAEKKIEVKLKAKLKILAAFPLHAALFSIPPTHFLGLYKEGEQRSENGCWAGPFIVRVVGVTTLRSSFGRRICACLVTDLQRSFVRAMGRVLL